MTDFWEKIDQRRTELELSRAEMARRAGISESTVTKGLKNRSRPSGAVRRQLERILDDELASRQAAQ